MTNTNPHYLGPLVGPVMAIIIGGVILMLVMWAYARYEETGNPYAFLRTLIVACIFVVFILVIS